MRQFRYLLAFCLSLPASAAAAPPVQRPIACAPSYCVDVIATAPDRVSTVTTKSSVLVGTSTMTLEMGRGFVVAFSSRYLDRRVGHVTPDENIWRLDGNFAKSWGCLRCGNAGGKDAVIGVAVTGIPANYDIALYGLEVCYWPLDMSTAGYGDGKSLRLGQKTCIRATAP